MIEALEREREESIWLSENMLRLVREHGIQFVAIRNQAVMAHADRFCELIAKLEADGEDSRSMKIELLSDDNTPRIVEALLLLRVGAIENRPARDGVDAAVAFRDATAGDGRLLPDRLGGSFQ